MTMWIVPAVTIQARTVHRHHHNQLQGKLMSIGLFPGGKQWHFFTSNAKHQDVVSQ